MKAKSSKLELERSIQQAGSELLALTPAEGIRHMLEFYRQVRVENCPLDEDGDMLLFQWGTYDWGQGRFFQCDITRQFIESQSDDDPGMTQLSLTFNYSPSAQLDALKAGNLWCKSPDGLAEFESFVKATEAYRAVARSKPTKISLEHGAV